VQCYPGPSGIKPAHNTCATGHRRELEGIIGASIRSVKPPADSTQKPGRARRARRRGFIAPTAVPELLHRRATGAEWHFHRENATFKDSQKGT